MEEVLQMVKERQGASSKRFEAQQNWRAPLKDRGIASAPTKAEESFTDVQIDRKQDTEGTLSKHMQGTDGYRLM